MISKVNRYDPVMPRVKGGEQRKHNRQVVEGWPPQIISVSMNKCTRR